MVWLSFGVYCRLSVFVDCNVLFIVRLLCLFCVLFFVCCLICVLSFLVFCFLCCVARGLLDVRYVLFAVCCLLLAVY